MIIMSSPNSLRVDKFPDRARRPRHAFAGSGRIQRPVAGKNLGFPEMQLIPQKLKIPAVSRAVHRPRLISALIQSVLTGSATVINGRAGTGKTTLAAQFATGCSTSAAWYQLDASDSDWRLFSQYLTKCFRHLRPDFGSPELKEICQTATVEDMPLCAEMFVFELIRSTGTGNLIVIEDLHLICDAEWVIPFFN